MTLPIFLSSSNNFFSIKQIADIPYSPQTQDMIGQNTLHTVAANKKVKRKYTGTLLSFLSRANFTRFWCTVVFKPITIVGMPLFLPICRILKAGQKRHKKRNHFPNGLFVPKNIRNVECSPFQVYPGSVVILFNTLNSEIQQLLSCISFSRTRSNIFGCEQHFICQVVLHHLFNNLT